MHETIQICVMENMSQVLFFNIVQMMSLLISSGMNVVTSSNTKSASKYPATICAQTYRTETQTRHTSANIAWRGPYSCDSADLSTINVNTGTHRNTKSSAYDSGWVWLRLCVRRKCRRDTTYNCHKPL